MTGERAKAVDDLLAELRDYDPVAYRQQEPLPAWIQPAAPVGRAAQLHALDIITADLATRTDELDRKMRALNEEIRHPFRQHDPASSTSNPRSAR